MNCEITNDITINHLIERVEATGDKSEKFKLLRNKVKSLACTQTGSRFLQKELIEAKSPALIEFILDDLGESLAQTTTDRYGNYFCQKLLAYCSPK